jgi:hypothetical protein
MKRIFFNAYLSYHRTIAVGSQNLCGDSVLNAQLYAGCWHKTRYSLLPPVSVLSVLAFAAQSLDYSWVSSQQRGYQSIKQTGLGIYGQCNVYNTIFSSRSCFGWNDRCKSHNKHGEQGNNEKFQPACLDIIGNPDKAKVEA